MNTLSFTGEMARLQQAIAESHDLVVCQGTVLEALNLRTSERVLEVGCGGGYLTYEAARFVGPTGRVCAIDISPDQIAAAQQRGAEFGWSNAAPRISRRRLTAMRSSMPFLPFKSSNI
jgi:ubiquinone/menaquinone biosynthesis C-methylase UbiE